jgi:Flp pilus assembly protein TadB
MTALMLIGAAIGATLFVLLWACLRPQPSVLVRLGRFDAQHRDAQHRDAQHRDAQPGDAHYRDAHYRDDRHRVHSPSSAPAETGTGDGRTLLTRLGGWVAAELTSRGVAYTSLRQDLALTPSTFETVLARKVLGAVAGFGAVLMVAAGSRLTGVLSLPSGTAAVLAVLAAVVGFLLPDLQVRRLARRRRAEFRRALGLYLELVSLEMAASAAPAEALPAAARVGSGWPFVLLRDTLFRSTRAGQDTWEALTELGERLGIGELRDLGALTRLVAHDGAQVRQSLTARAGTMRRRDLAEAQGSAGQRDQAMRMAQAVIGMGFIVFLGYPALANILSF